VDKLHAFGATKVKTGETAAFAKDTASNVADAAKDQAPEAGDVVSAKAGEASSYVSEKASQVQEAVAETKGTLVERVQLLENRFTAYMESNDKALSIIQSKLAHIDMS
jgi:hypothetical protein